ncbi:MAG TPA: phosphoenolpyruvate--protein phosphotransferase [Anaerovoracaceae bacterium]|nr:phosphoenolpyruvate--protein phosphotransferase [Anaerovoracaceae bacterium]
MKKGVACSPGLAVEKVYILKEPEIPADLGSIQPGQVDRELGKLNSALDKSIEQMEAIYQKALQSTGKEEAEIFQAHQMILEDPVFREDMEGAIRDGRLTAAHAVVKTVEEQAAVFETIDDAYLRERAADIRDIGKRLLYNVLGIEIKDVSSLKENVILAAHDITPSLMATIDREHVKGILAEVGGATAHTAILARNLEIPAILGASGILSDIKDGDTLILDGGRGDVEISPDETKITEAYKKIEKTAKIKRELSLIKDVESRTKDGRRVELAANIGGPADTGKVLEYGADGIGLFRTEFLYMDRCDAPNEEEQFTAYRKVLQDLGGKPVIIRTLDVGGDKEIPYFNMEKEENPFLGYRAIRICLDDTELFKTQLRAILRASIYGNALIMFPMIASVDEVVRAKEVIEEAKAELRQKGQDYAPDVKVGIMVEIPSAAVAADLFVDNVDFFSIGTNDLTQYTLAVDRGNTKVSSLYKSFHPALLRLFKKVVEASESRDGLFTGMCGELAGNPLATLLLVGLGFRELSMSPSSILKVKKIVTSVDTGYAKQVAEHALSLTGAGEVEAYLKGEIVKLGLDYLLEL